MNHLELDWKAYDGMDLFAQAWEPATLAPKSVICLVHGLGEHTSRYAHVAEALGMEGHILMGADLRGHGKSGGDRGHIDSMEDFMRDIDLSIQQARLRYPGLPIFLYGHSLGGIQALYYGLSRKPDIQGVIVTSPGLHTALEQQRIKVLMAKLFGALMPKTSIASGLDPNGISRDQKVVKTYVDDPLVHNKISFGFGKIMIEAIAWVLSNASSFPLPLLLMHGKSDAIAFPSSSTDFSASLSENCTLVLWDDAYHELHNEPIKEDVFKVMTSWMKGLLDKQN